MVAQIGPTPLYVFDLDGTLTDLEHRLPLIKDKEKPDWDGFLEACVNDTPVTWVMGLLHILRSNGEILILSGRSDQVEKETREWLKEYGILYDYLIMRKKGNHKPDWLIKRWMLEDFLRDKDFEVQFIVDDRQSVVDMWRKHGYNVLQCSAWNDFKEKKTLTPEEVIELVKHTDLEKLAYLINEKVRKKHE